MSTARTPENDASARVQPGDILADKYRVERVLGAGGMGIVVLAEHLDLREKVAIKFLLDEALQNAELAERFLREARAAVKIKSEHVVRVIDVGRLPSNAPYMVMEYLEGEDLSQTLERGRVPIEDAVDYVIQSCEAMSVAHRAGIVHRDLKPANLFLSRRPDGSPIVKVLDFGISKVHSTEVGQMNLTHTQAMMGSPLYMSPEQMRSSKDVDRRTDIWSLGVILHELLAGDVPFSGQAFPEVLLKVMTEPPPPLRALRPEVPEELEKVVLRCLAKSPPDRYSSVSALAVALTPFASSRTVGLQGRLHQSMSGRAPPLDATMAADSAVAPAAPAGPVLATTRVERDKPMDAQPAPGPAKLGDPAPSSLGAAEERPAPAATNTSWEGQSRALPAVRRQRSRWAVAAVALGAALAMAALLAGYLRSTSATPTGTASPEPAAASIDAPPPPAPVAADIPSPPREAGEARVVPEPSAPSVSPQLPPSPPARVEPVASSTAPKVTAPKARPARPVTTRPRARAETTQPPPPAPSPAPAPPRPARKALSIEFK
jgi:eukaryotic-like serine/threonine-protein kinase